MATNASQDDWHKTGLRLPKDLHARLHAAATQSGRSYNAELVHRLQQSMDIQQAAPHMYSADPEVKKIAADHMARLSMDLMRVDPDFKRGMQEMLAKAILIANQERPGLEDGASAPPSTPPQEK